ncbi:MAG: hypothetical protein IPF49_03695 [Gammaproteobacteria bacterium]|nr:hypothetical protein [Gammaproteobacteria bacterium]
MNNQSAVRALVLGFGMAFMPSLVMADVIYTSFGSLPQGVPPATFGGSGNPRRCDCGDQRDSRR